MKKPKFEFKNFNVDELYELLELYRSTAVTDKSNSVLDLNPFLEELDLLKESIENGKKYKPFPKFSFNARSYCINMYNHLERVREDFATKKSRAISKQNKSDKIRNELESSLEKLESNFEHLKLSSVYPEKIGQMDLVNKYLREKNLDRDYFLNEYKKIISSRTANVGSENLIFYPDIAQYFTIIETDKILIENGMKDYGLYEITRSSHPEVNKGINFYSFDDDDNLLMMAPPYRVMGHNKSQYIIFDATLYESNKVVRIPKSEILSYKLYGTELMQSTVSTNARPNEVQVSDNNVSNAYERPSITGTFFSSLLFGSTYTLLNGVGKALHNQTNMLGDKLDNLGGKLDKVVEAINSISITTDHKIIDTSRVQIVLTNRRDLEIDGINIFYDLNRVYPNFEVSKIDSAPRIEGDRPYKANMTEEVLKLKDLFDQGVIDEEEFKAMKKKLIS